jgi:hypothetical protein
MANFITNGRTDHSQQQVFLNSEQLVGVQSVEMNYQVNNQELKYLGLNKCRYIPSGPQQGQASVNSLLITTDQLIQLTGHTGANLYVFKDQTNTADNFSCVSGYCNTYSCRGSANQIPEISVSLTIFGDIGRIARNLPQTAAINRQITNDFSLIPSAISTLPLKVGSFNSTTINIDDFITNRIQSFDLSINSTRFPIYSLGSKYPINIELISPQQVSFNFSIELNDYEASRIRDYPFSEEMNDLVLTIKDHDDNSIISTYSFNRMIKISESYSSNTNAPVTLSLGYQSYYA